MNCTMGRKTVPDEAYLKARTRIYELYKYPTRNKTKQCNSKSCENKPSITVPEPVPPLTLLLITTREWE